MGGVPWGSLIIFFNQSFNPRPRMGGDEVRIYDRVLTASVSIHAPAWGATSLLLKFGRVLRCFNPRPRMGGDMVRHTALKYEARFNPRPRMGGDLRLNYNDHGHNYVSIHAPAWGATKLTIPPARFSLFQSTPPHGGRHFVNYIK